MKNMNLNESVRILLLVASVIIICILCATGLKLTKAGQSGVGSAAGQLTGMVSDYSDIDVSLYDGSIIKGSEVASLIKKAAGEGDCLAIEVLTLDGSTRAYNYRFDYGSLTVTQEGVETEPPKDNSQYGYINAAANFLGASYRNENGNIVCLRFEQQK
ncbi:MAG TPA: hypothetical protein GXX75_25850 [Clostridiales bacterium]|nr:hypothetical protein [Clostridiales bacterium]